MNVKETGVSYYGVGYPDHAEKDFREMIEHNCNAVILALSEFDIDFWLPSIMQVARTAKNLGLKVYLDTWGIGKWFGGEPASNFLTNNVRNRQVSALTGESLPNACFNTEAFREYFYGICEKLATEVDAADGFFWDEPHYALPKSLASITGGAADDWSCRCPVCQQKFKNIYGYEMPKILSSEVIQFRENQALEIIRTASEKIKAIRPDSKIICCVHATQNSYYVTERRGYDNWDKVGKEKAIDVFSTTIINYSLPLSFFKNITKRTVDIAKKYGKGNQRWIMGYYNEPENLDYVKDIAHLYDEMGVESIFAWTYRGGAGTVLAAPHALELWDKIGEAYGEVLDPECNLNKK